MQPGFALDSFEDLDARLVSHSTASLWTD
jgi:hypothetical protein